jgi:hypothetical protein
MEEDFYATIKLVSGEEIICRISYLPEEESCLIHEPMEVEHVSRTKKNLSVDGFTLTEWIHSTFDDMFVLPKKHILTMTECDEKITEFYLRCLSNDKKAKSLTKFHSEGKKGDPSKILPGYIGSVEQSRELLEKIFKCS